MDGDKFANFVPVADARFGALALVFQILRRHAHGGVGKEDIVFADLRDAFHVHVRHQARARADFDIGADDAVRPDFSAFRDPSLRIDDGSRMNRHARLRPLAPALPLGGFAILQHAHQHGLGHHQLRPRWPCPCIFAMAGLALGDFHLDAKLIARPHLAPELGFFDGCQQHQLVLAVGQRLQHQHARHLRHGLHHQHARHHRKIGKMAHKERLIDGDVLDSDDALLFQLQDGIHQKHRIAMRQNVADLLDVEKGHANWLL